MKSCHDAQTPHRTPPLHNNKNTRIKTTALPGSGTKSVLPQSLTPESEETSIL